MTANRSSSEVERHDGPGLGPGLMSSSEVRRHQVGIHRSATVASGARGSRRHARGVGAAPRRLVLVACRRNSVNTVRQIGGVLVSPPIMGSSASLPHQTRKLRQTHRAEDDRGTGASSNRVRDRNPRFTCRRCGGRVQNDCCAAVRLTQGVYAELVQHARWKTLFPQISVLRISDGDDMAVSKQDVVRLRRW